MVLCVCVCVSSSSSLQRRFRFVFTCCLCCLPIPGLNSHRNRIRKRGFFWNGEQYTPTTQDTIFYNIMIDSKTPNAGVPKIPKSSQRILKYVYQYFQDCYYSACIPFSYKPTSGLLQKKKGSKNHILFWVLVSSSGHYTWSGFCASTVLWLLLRTNNPPVVPFVPSCFLKNEFGRTQLFFFRQVCGNVYSGTVRVHSG